VVKKTRLGFVVTGLLLGILMASMDNTIVATAMGTIVADLGGLDKFVWVTSAYMVAEMAGMPIFGKLSDMYGRKRFFIFGIALFIIGSMLCGTAHTIVQLSLYRALQGIGGGALVPIAFTIMFDVFPVEHRGKMGGLFGAVFGLSSIFGPLLGAYITQYINWKWVFYINWPLGLVAFILIFVFYHESYVHEKQKVDWYGSITLVAAVVCLMFALELGGNSYAWVSVPILALFAGFAVLTIVFVFVERVATEPVISFAMLRNRLFGTSSMVGFFYGATFIVATVYIPIFIQGVMGGSATNSGLVLLPMMLGSVVTAAFGGTMLNKLSYRNVMLISGVIFVVGFALLTTLSTSTTRFLITIFMVVVGLGTGFSFSVLGTAAVHPFDIRQRGSANSTMAFLRSLGMTLGITIYGIIQRNIFAHQLTTAFANGKANTPSSGTLGDPHAMLSPITRAHIPAFVLQKLTDALSFSIAHTFIWLLIPAVIAFVSVFFMSPERLIPVRDNATEAGSNA